MTDNAKGAVLMMLSMLSFTINDAAMKAASASLPLGQQVFLRGLLVSVIFGWIVWRQGGHRQPFPRSDWARVITRSLAEVAAAYFFLTALFNMPLANATAILLLLPLVVSLAAHFILGETLGWRRLSAIAIGFVGMLFIVKPGTEGFNWATVYGLVAVGCVTLRDLVTRNMSKSISNSVVTFTVAICVTVAFGGYAMTEDWAKVDSASAFLLGIAVIAVCTGYYASVAVMRVGEVSFVAGFRYSSLLFSLFLGYAVFGEWPDGWTLFGAMIIVVAGLFMLWRQRAVTG